MNISIPWYDFQFGCILSYEEPSQNIVRLSNRVYNLTARIGKL